MPVVPTYESKVTLQPNNAGGTIEPLNTSKLFPGTAPDFSKAGAALMKVQKQMDTARAVEIKNAARQYVLDATYGENGYTKVLGKNALEQDEEGQGLTQRNLAGYDKYMDEFLAKGNFTQAQIQMARQDIFDVRLSFQSGLGSHVLGEEKRYKSEQVSAEKNNAISAGLLAKSPQELAAARADLDMAIQHEADIFGYDGDVLKVKKAESVSQFHTSMIQNELLKADKDPIGAYQRAKGYYEASRKELDATTAVKLQALLNEARLSANAARTIQLAECTDLITDNEGANVGTRVMTNGTKTTAEVMYKNMTIGNTQASSDQTVRRYANGGYGISGLRLEDAIKTARASENLITPGTTDEQIKERFLTDRGFNFMVGQARWDTLMKQYGDVEKAAAAYHYGEETLEDAVGKASAEGDGDNWLKYMPKDSQTNLRNLIMKTREQQEGVVRGSDGKIVNPWDADFIEKINPIRTDEQRRTLIQKTIPDVRNPLELESLVDKLRAVDIKKLNDKKLAYQQNVYKCIKAMEQGQALPQDALNDLPISARRWLGKLENKRTMGDGTPDWDTYARCKNDAQFLRSMSEEHYETYVRPMLGNKAEEIDLLRATEQVNAGLTRDRRYENNVKANGGIAADEFNPTDENIRTSMSEIFRKPWKDIEGNYGLLIRIRDAATIEAQRRSRYSANGKTIPLKDSELTEFVRKLYRDVTEEGVVPFYIPLKKIPNRTAGDARLGIEWLASRMTEIEIGPGIPPTDDIREIVWSRCLTGANFKGQPTFEEIKAAGPVFSQEKLAEAEAQLKSEEKPITSASILNRYFLLLCGWKPKDSAAPKVTDTTNRNEQVLTNLMGDL